MKFIAIVLKHDGSMPMERPAAITGDSKPDVICSAIEKRREFYRKCDGPYRILVGTLTEEVVESANYTVKELL